MGKWIGDHLRLQYTIERQKAIECDQWIERGMLARLDGDHGEGFSSSQVTRHVLLSRGAKTFKPEGWRRRALDTQHQNAFRLPEEDGLASACKQRAAISVVRCKVKERDLRKPYCLQSTLQGHTIHRACNGMDRRNIACGQTGVGKRLSYRSADPYVRIGTQRGWTEGRHTYANHIDATLHRALLK